MKRFTINLLSTFLAFAAGLVTASSWNTTRLATAEPVLRVIERCPPGQNQAPPASTSISVPIDREHDFGQGLKLVPEKVQLKSVSMRYDIDVKYPQIVMKYPGIMGGNPNISKVNEHIKAIATEKYQWPLKLTKEEVRIGQETLPGTYNSVNVDYEISLATDSLLSFHFVGYSYGVGAAHAVQESAPMNYDLTSGRQLKLDDIFKPGSRYLQFISEHCSDALVEVTGRPEALNKQALAPVAKNFDSWHITNGGITFNFDACEVFACAEGDQAVAISFSDLQPFLNSGIPRKFKIIYP